jgi:hypothetical protein
MFYDQKAVMVLFKDGHKLEGYEGPPNIKVSEISIQPAEYAGVIAADVEDFVTLQVEDGTDL